LGILLPVVVSALTGGLAGSLVNLTRNWWREPILKILFQENEKGCLITTNFVGGNELLQRYVRLKVRNAGRSTAKDVSICVVKLRFEAPDEDPVDFEQEVLDLKVAMTPDQITFRLAAGAHQYVDLWHTQKEHGGVAFMTDFVATPATLAFFPRKPGIYRAEVFVSADNAPSVGYTASWSWDGQYPGLHILGITQAGIIDIGARTEKNGRE
jgi:hypothetical protein